MARKIEQLLRIAADMQRFSGEDSVNAIFKTSFDSDELFENDLELIAAAAQEPVEPDFLRKNEKK